MKKIILIIIITIFLTTSCSYVELNNIAIANTLAIDFIDGNYEVTIQILDLKKDSSGNNDSEKDVIYKGSGKTITNAIRNVSLSYPKELYLGHLSIVIIGKDLINSDLEEIFEYFIRTPAVRNDFYILVNSTGKASEILDSPKEKSSAFPSKELVTTLEVSAKEVGATTKVNMEEFINAYINDTITPIIPNIKKDNDVTTLNGIVAVNKKDKKLILLDDELTTTYNFIFNNFLSSPLTIDYKDAIIDVLIGLPKNKIKSKIENGNITFDINIDVSLQPSEIRTKINLEDPKVEKEIQNKINEKIKENINKLLTFCKDNDIDVLNLNNILYKNHFKEYKDITSFDIYNKANFNITVKSHLSRYGNLYRSTKGE